LPIDTVYSYEPIPAQLDAAAATHILGAQGQVWTEYIEGPKNVEYMAFPRAAALAEALWTPQAEKNFADFTARLARQTSILQALDVNYRPLTKPAATAITP
jgi:hexosaminidase